MSPVTSPDPSEHARLHYVEEKLYWTGAVSPADLTRRWAVSRAQAQVDLARYLEMAGTAVRTEDDGFLIAAADYRPLLVRDLGFERYLHMIEEDSGFVDVADDLATLSRPQRPVKDDVARAIVQAIEAGLDLRLSYLSLSSGQGDRWLAPHAFGHDGMRWHVRAYDYGRERFGDFVLSRIESCSDRRPRRIDVEDDCEWHELVELAVIPNPALPDHKQKAVRQDFGMQDGRAVLRLRRAMLFYAADQLRLNSCFATLPPEMRQVVPEDPEKLQALLRGETSGATG